MTSIMEQLYDMVSDHTHIEQAQMPRYKALARARLAVLEELEKDPGRGNQVELWDVLSSLEGQSENLRSQALFQAALRLGMELGRMAASGSEIASR